MADVQYETFAGSPGSMRSSQPPTSDADGPEEDTTGWAASRGHRRPHAVTVTGIARDRYDGALLGFYVNDSGTGQSGQFISAHLMTTAFEREGGFCVVTDRAGAVGPRQAGTRSPGTAADGSS